MSLDAIARRNGTDKSSLHHNYSPFYEKFFEPLRNDQILLLELGCGGYSFPDRGFEGAKTWAEYFHHGRVVTIDIHKKNVPALPKIEFYQGSQDDSVFLNKLITSIGSPDIIIDDASHINPLTIKSFGILFPLLKPGGIYVIEDLESSWWEDVASDGTDFKGCKDMQNFAAPTAINMVRKLVNDVNVRKTGYPEALPVASIHFYDNIAFIVKKK